MKYFFVLRLACINNQHLKEYSHDKHSSTQNIYTGKCGMIILKFKYFKIYVLYTYIHKYTYKKCYEFLL